MVRLVFNPLKYSAVIYTVVLGTNWAMLALQGCVVISLCIISAFTIKNGSVGYNSTIVKYADVTFYCTTTFLKNVLVSLHFISISLFFLHALGHIPNSWIFKGRYAD